jgi:uncharacterized protein YacL
VSIVERKLESVLLEKITREDVETVERTMLKVSKAVANEVLTNISNNTKVFAINESIATQLNAEFYFEHLYQH